MSVCKAFHNNVKRKHIPVVDISFKMSLVGVNLSISHFFARVFSVLKHLIQVTIRRRFLF